MAFSPAPVVGTEGAIKELAFVVVCLDDVSPFPLLSSKLLSSLFPVHFTPFVQMAPRKKKKRKERKVFLRGRKENESFSFLLSPGKSSRKSFVIVTLLRFVLFARRLKWVNLET